MRNILKKLAVLASFLFTFQTSALNEQEMDNIMKNEVANHRGPI